LNRPDLDFCRDDFRVIAGKTIYVFLSEPEINGFARQSTLVISRTGEIRLGGFGEEVL
jgi:UDP-N-acetylglucosamine transferase subunit ALG13